MLLKSIQTTPFLFYGPEERPFDSHAVFPRGLSIMMSWVIAFDAFIINVF